MKKIKIPSKICAFCGKGSSIGLHKPHSLHRTKKLVQPNLQWFTDLETKTKVLICARCKRTKIRQKA